MRKQGTAKTVKKKEQQQPQPQALPNESSEQPNLTVPPTQSDSGEKSTVKTYRPPDGSPPVLCIHTTPTLMKRLSQFLRHFDRPPQQLFLEFVFVEVNEDDVAQFRYKLNHPLLDSIYGQAADDHVRTSPLDDDVEQTALGTLGGIGQGRTRRVRRLPESLTPRI